MAEPISAENTSPHTASRPRNEQRLARKQSRGVISITDAALGAPSIDG
jgi:hypothetical protein